jgi:hypothetical protein
MGPSAGAFGMAAYANAPTRPTNSTNALSERFMGLLSLGSTKYASRLPGNWRGNYTGDFGRRGWMGSEMMGRRATFQKDRTWQNALHLSCTNKGAFVYSLK